RLVELATEEAGARAGEDGGERAGAAGAGVGGPGERRGRPPSGGGQRGEGRGGGVPPPPPAPRRAGRDAAGAPGGGGLPGGGGGGPRRVVLPALQLGALRPESRRGRAVEGAPADGDRLLEASDVEVRRGEEVLRPAEVRLVAVGELAAAPQLAEEVPARARV